MSNSELKETLIAIGRTPGIFYRDTPMLFRMLDSYRDLDRRLKNIGHEPERRFNKKPAAPENQKFDNY